jgi:hypothetical protein
MFFSVAMLDTIFPQVVHTLTNMYVVNKNATTVALSY